MSTGSTDTPQKKTAAHGFKEGDLIGESYRILSFIGEGAMGEVYRAKHEMMPREYALKVLNTNQITENSWRRFQIEAQAIARMNHPNVVVIYNLGVHAGRLPFYVMDLLSGESLFDRLNRVEQLSVAEALPLFIQVCEGLGYAHKKGIVHRDIKPHNIVVLNEQEASGALVKIVDFGIAKLAETKDLQNQQLTKMGEVFGTPYYMSPEQSMGQRVDGRSDIYSLGCTLFEALVSTPPFRGKSSTETMLLHQTAEPPTLAKASGGQTFPESVEFIVAKMLAKEPMERYQSMEAVKHDLELALQGKDLSVLPYMATSQRQNYDTTGGTTSNSATAGRTTSSSSATGRTTARQTQPKLTPQEDSGQYTIPPASSGLGFKLGIAAMAVVLLAGAAGAYFLLKPRDTTAGRDHQSAGGGGLLTLPGTEILNSNAASPKIADMNIAQSVADMTMVTDIRNGTGPNLKGKPTSASEKGKYSRLATVDGKRIIEFNFPKDVPIGTIAAARPNEKTANSYSAASGKVVFELNTLRFFQPNPVLVTYPNYTHRFQNGDLYGIYFGDPMTNAALINSCRLIPGIKCVKVNFCKDTGPGAGEALTKYRGLKSLILANCDIVGDTFANSDFLSTLTDFKFERGAKFRTPLKILCNHKRLTELSLANCDLETQDFTRIGELRELKVLNISKLGGNYSASSLQALTSLHKLEHLTIGAAKLPKDTPKILKQMPSLKFFVMDCRLNNNLLEKIGAVRPDLKLLNFDNGVSNTEEIRDLTKLRNGAPQLLEGL